MSRNRREHGRIISVETHTRGDALAEDAAAGATSITVEDAGDFDEDGGWLTIGGQVVEFSECDDDTGVILLVDPLTAAAEQGDPVQVWSDLYEEVIDYQLALVELGGEEDNPDPVVAEVAEGVGELPEGDRGRAGESCTLKRVSDDEWEVVAVGGRSKKSQSIRFHQDPHTVADLGEQQIDLTYLPIDNSEHVYWNGLYQPGTEWTRDGQTISVPDDSELIVVGDELVVEYAYRKGINTPDVVPEPGPVAQLVSADARRSSPGASLDYDSDAKVYNGPIQLGDLMIKAAVTTYGSTPSATASWTLLDSYENPETASNNGIRAMLWYKYADADTLASPQQTTSIGSSGSTAGAMVVLRGASIGAVTVVKAKMPDSPAEGGPASVPDASVTVEGSSVALLGVVATDASIPDMAVPDQICTAWGSYAGAAAGLITNAPVGAVAGGATATIKEESAYYAMWRIVCPPSS